MSYTVKQLAEISGVSARTLHWYDEIGLLKPSFCGQNGYRYYDKNKLLELQQILFFRELGFPLGDIKVIIAQKDFDTVAALITHKKNLEQIIVDKTRLIKTIDKTVSSLKGEQEMEDKGLFDGFDAEKQKGYENYLIEKKGKVAKDLIGESKARVSKWDPEKWNSVGAQSHQACLDLAKMIDQGLSIDSDEVQEAISRHYEWLCNFYNPTKEVYSGLGELYSSHEDFIKFYAGYHEKMPNFLSKAMRFYADKNLK